ncbi:MAG: SGNH/GDSL hydrolase family protein [Lachnospiraceae bacterium]|nr:SGNH/GDSL hydrolase family protein [Lachnospiraceae bacterium]
MILSNKELKNIYLGAYEFEETEDGYLQAFQYSKPQMDYFRRVSDFWYDRCMASTAKTIEMETSSRKISFEYKIIWKGSDDSFELMVDDLISEIVYVKDISDEGTIEWELPEGKKDIVIYLPVDATVLLRNFTVDAGVKQTVRGEKVLWLGDSITQGFGPLRSAQTYVSVANRLLHYDILNQGIGAYVYDKNSLMPMDGYHPDKIIVALGTNQYGCETMKDVEEYYERLMEIYGDRIPVLCISPLWRGDHPEEMSVLERFCENVIRIADSYPNVMVIDGFRLVPHFSEYFLDDLHPNCLGMEIYGRNLVEEIRNLGF